MSEGTTSMSSTKSLLHMLLACTLATAQLTQGAMQQNFDAIELRYQTEEELGPYEYPWLEDDEWNRLDDERSDIEDELGELFNTVIGFEYDCNPFKN